MQASDGNAIFDTVIRGGRVLTPDGEQAISIGIRGGRIAALADDLSGREVIDADGQWVLPGVIDGHTHMEAPAFGMLSRDTFETGTAAAAAGGVTTILDFTVGGSDTTLVEQIDARRMVAQRAVVDFGFHAEIVGWRPDRLAEIRAAVDAGVTSFKFYMVYDERSDHAQLLDAFRAIAATGGVAMIHAEDDEIVSAARSALLPRGRVSMRDFGRSRPPVSESAAVELICHLAGATGVRLHIAHVSTAAACEVVRRAKARGIDVTAETCPHYLLLDEAVYERSDARQFSVVPPLRTAADTEALWDGLEDGTLDTVTTDHCPFLLADKTAPGNVLEIPCGLPGVETLLPLLHSEAVVRRGLSMEWLASCLSDSPARRFGLAPAKGRVEVGADADLVLFDSDREWTVSAERLHTATDFSPYEGMKLSGAVSATLIRGRTVYAEGQCAIGQGWGRFISRNAAG